jgi:hypothetical protein
MTVALELEAGLRLWFYTLRRWLGVAADEMKEKTRNSATI